MHSHDWRRWIDEQFEGPALLPADSKARKAALQLLTRGAGAFSSAGLSLLGGRTGGCGPHPLMRLQLRCDSASPPFGRFQLSELLSLCSCSSGHSGQLQVVGVMLRTSVQLEPDIVMQFSSTR